MYPWTAIGYAALVVNAMDVLYQSPQCILLFLLLLPLLPGIIAAPRYTQYTALLPNRVSRLVLLNELISHLASFE
jgi:hypothetical protein